MPAEIETPVRGLGRFEDLANYKDVVAHIADVAKVVDDEMTAYRDCLEVYKLGDFLDSDIICDAVLDALEYNNKKRARTVQRSIEAQADPGNEADGDRHIGSSIPVDIQPFIGFRDSFCPLCENGVFTPRAQEQS